MTVIQWDQPGDRIYQTGIDRGVLNLMDGTLVPWNGLTGLEDGTTSELKSYYLDGIKFLEHVTPGEFVGKLTAFTYPDEFDQVLGQSEIAPGLSIHEQPTKPFNLSYRSLIGNEFDQDLGYKLHFLYNLSAIPDSFKFETAQNSISPGEFSWSLTGVPVLTFNKRPAVQITIDSTKVDPAMLLEVEEALYGTDDTEPHFPSMLEIRHIFGELGGLVIIDNGDGTWTAEDPSNDFITMLDADSFQIDHANAVYTDLDAYQISDTDTPLP